MGKIAKRRVNPVHVVSPLLLLTLSGICALARESGSANGSLPQGGDPNVNVYFLPLVGHGTMGNLRFSTELTFFNLATTLSGQVTVETFDSGGSPLSLLEGENGQSTSNVVFTDIPVLGASSVRSLNANPEDTLDSGWARVFTDRQTSLEVVFRIVDTRTNTVITSANVTPNSSRQATFFSARVEAPVDTGVAIIDPPVDLVAEVTLEAFNAAGVSMGTREITLQPGERVSQFIGQIFGFTDFNGTIEIRSSASISILPLRQEDVVLTTQPLFQERVLQ